MLEDSDSLICVRKASFNWLDLTLTVNFLVFNTDSKSNYQGPNYCSFENVAFDSSSKQCWRCRVIEATFASALHSCH